MIDLRMDIAGHSECWPQPGPICLSGPAQATEQSRQRQQGRDVNQAARQEARSTKIDCRQENNKSNAQCRQDKRETKQEGRQEKREIKY